jgi:hypothetical protein
MLPTVQRQGKSSAYSVAAPALAADFERGVADSACVLCLKHTPAGAIAGPAVASREQRWAAQQELELRAQHALAREVLLLPGNPVLRGGFVFVLAFACPVVPRTCRAQSMPQGHVQ